ncbi:MAG: hypothetical protein ABR600_12650 [Actinomycetota bacterium]|nr:hypothetical protein [Actinomycetota bacterium]
MSIQLTSGHFAWAALGPHECEPDPPDFGTCLYWRLFYLPDYPYKPSSFFGTDPPTVAPGLYDVYFVSDGGGTLTLNFAGLDGAVSLQASGSIDATLQKLSASCPESQGVDPDCRHFGHGGATHAVRQYAEVASVAYAWIPSQLLGVEPPGTVSAAACAYPSLFSPGGSADPTDHPRGCPLLPTDPDWESDDNDTIFVLRAVAAPAGFLIGVLNIDGWDAASGPEYLGFAGEQRATEEALNDGGAYAGWGLWVNTGIQCDAACIEASSL